MRIKLLMELLESQLHATFYESFKINGKDASPINKQISNATIAQECPQEVYDTLAAAGKDKGKVACVSMERVACCVKKPHPKEELSGRRRPASALKIYAIVA